MMGIEERAQDSTLPAELGAQAFISVLYSMSRNTESFPGLSGIARTSNGFRVEFLSPVSDEDNNPYIVFRSLPMGKETIRNSDTSMEKTGTGHLIRLMLDSLEFQVGIEGSREITEKITALPQGSINEYLAGAFPFPSFSSMSLFQRFLCMTHGLSVSSPVRRNLILDTSVAEMSILSVDESRDEVRRSNAHALSLMISSKAVIENAKGVHLPRSLNEFMKRYRTRLKPYLLRIRKSTIFDFEK